MARPLPTLLLGLCALVSACSEAAPADAPSLVELLQTREYLKVISIAEEGLTQTSRADEAYRDLWIARAEAWMHVAPQKADEGLSEELARTPRWLQPEDVLYLGAKLKEAGRFRDCLGTFRQAFEAWPDDPSIRAAFEDADLEFRGRRWWHDCTPSREAIFCGCCWSF